MSIEENKQNIEHRMRVALRAVQREPNAARLMAVSKKQSVTDIELAIAAGQRLFGENYVAEAIEKFTPLCTRYADLELHLIGHLQTNKVMQAVSFFDCIQTLDRPKLAEALASARQKVGRMPQIYIEVNAAEEAQKSGVLPRDFESLYNLAKNTYHIDVSGIMAVPPAGADPKPYFEMVVSLAQQVALPHITHVSLGMSSDFEQALAAGSTEVRIGTQFFGARAQKM